MQNKFQNLSWKICFLWSDMELEPNRNRNFSKIGTWSGTINFLEVGNGTGTLPPRRWCSVSLSSTLAGLLPVAPVKCKLFKYLSVFRIRDVWYPGPYKYNMILLVVLSWKQILQNSMERRQFLHLLGERERWNSPGSNLLFFARGLSMDLHQGDEDRIIEQ